MPLPDTTEEIRDVVSGGLMGFRDSLAPGDRDLGRWVLAVVVVLELSAVVKGRRAARAPRREVAPTSGRGHRVEEVRAHEGHDETGGDYVNEQEFTEWAAGCQRTLVRSAYLLTGDLHRAQDLVQEALVKVALRWSRLRDGNPTAYARTIIVRDNISWWRRRRDVLLVESDRVVGGVVSSDPEAALVVRRALMRLTPAQRAVLVLRHFDDLTEREAAETLGVSIGTVKSQNSAALARLRTGAPELLDLIGERHD